MKPLKESSLIICSIVRNAAKGLKKNIPVINELCSRAKDYKIIIFENNSQDQTKTLLKEWQRIIGEGHLFVSMYDTNEASVIPTAKEVTANPYFSEKRISKMVFLRNQYMNYVDNNGLTADYFIVVDLDVSRLTLPGILSSFETSKDWDAITANGYSLSPRISRRYHDTYALTEFGKEDIPQSEKMILDNAHKYGKLNKEDKLVRVFSAFGGLAIYQFEAVKGVKYQLLYNNDERVEVRCEHYSIYKQMKQRGYDKVYINPAMFLKYQTISFKIAVNTIKRKYESLKPVRHR